MESDFDAHKIQGLIRSLRKWHFKCEECEASKGGTLTLCPKPENHSSLWLRRREEGAGSGGCAKARQKKTLFLNRELKMYFIGNENILQEEYSGLFERVLHMQANFLRDLHRGRKTSEGDISNWSGWVNSDVTQVQAGRGAGFRG